MSGLYIPGATMPKSCIACPLNFGEKRPEHGLTICCPFSDGAISWRDNAFENGRLASCEIIPVPEHGDLIDRTAFRYEMDNHYPFDKATQSRHGVEDALKSAVLQMLLAAPTIIPADEEGEILRCAQDDKKSAQNDRGKVQNDKGAAAGPAEDPKDPSAETRDDR